MRIAITGPDGFLAWHTRCALRARQNAEAIPIGRPEYNDPQLMDAALAQADAVIHLAGVNRGPDSDVATVNPWLAEQLVAGLERSGRVIPVVYGNSIQSEGDSVFGVAKRQALDTLSEWGGRVGAPVIDVVLPNIFGEHGRPFYNSVVATFCHQLATGSKLRILTIVDVFSRFSPTIDPRFSYRGEDVVATLERVCAEVGYPDSIRVDQGSEFISRDLDLWAYQNNVTLDFSRPGKPTDNAFIEAFNGRLRAECLNTHWFLTLEDARRKLENWRREYNELRPHGAIGNKAPITLIDRPVATSPTRRPE